MNDATVLDADDLSEISANDKPGGKLQALRKKRKHDVEYVASKLHLRVCVIEALEADDYHDMPESVFIKGYIRAYANLLEVDPRPFLELFDAHSKEEPEERMLWQSQKETYKAEHMIRWGTGAFAVVVLAAVVLWWSKSKDTETFFSKHVRTTEDVRLTDLSNMRSLLSSNQQPLPPVELQDD